MSSKPTLNVDGRLDAVLAATRQEIFDAMYGYLTGRLTPSQLEDFRLRRQREVFAEFDHIRFHLDLLGKWGEFIDMWIDALRAALDKVDVEIEKIKGKQEDATHDNDKENSQ